MSTVLLFVGLLILCSGELLAVKLLGGIIIMVSIISMGVGIHWDNQKK